MTSETLNDQRQQMMLDSIRPGDRVTILVYAGIDTWKQKTGRAVMRGPAGYVLNMGGRYGSPAVANAKNLVRVVHRGKKGGRPASPHIGGRIGEGMPSAIAKGAIETSITTTRDNRVLMFQNSFILGIFNG